MSWSKRISITRIKILINRRVKRHMDWIGKIYFYLSMASSVCETSDFSTWLSQGFGLPGVFVLFHSVLKRMELYGWYMDMDMEMATSWILLCYESIGSGREESSSHLVTDKNPRAKKIGLTWLKLFGHLWLFYLPWFVFTCPCRQMSFVSRVH